MSHDKKSKKKRKREKPVESEEEKQWDRMCGELNLDACTLAEFRALTEADLTEFVNTVPVLKRGKFRLMHKPAKAVEATQQNSRGEEEEEAEIAEEEAETKEEDEEEVGKEEEVVGKEEEEEDMDATQIDTPNPVVEAEKPKKKKKKKDKHREKNEEQEEDNTAQRNINVNEPKSSKKSKRESSETSHTGHERNPTQPTPKSAKKPSSSSSSFSSSSSSSFPASSSSSSSFKLAKNSVISQTEGKMITVSFQVLDPKDPRGLLCCFPAGDPLEGNTTLLRNTKIDNKKHHKIVKYEAMGIDFYGKNFGNENNSSENGLAYAIGDAQKSEHGIEVTLIPVIDNTVFSMIPVVPEEEEDGESSKQITDFNTQRTMLAETYGSVKRQRMLRQTLNNQYDIAKDTESQAVMAVALEGAKAMGSIEMKLEYTALPPFDAVTHDMSKIYDIRSFIPQEVWDSIDIGPWLKLLSQMDQNDAQDEAKVHRMNTFVKRAFFKLLGIKPADRPPLVQNLMLLDYLMLFQLFPVLKKAETLQKFGHIPDAVKNYLLKSFTERSVRGGVVKEDTVTDNLQNRGKCLIFIVALSVRKFQLDEEDIQALSVELKMDKKMVAFYCVQVGCRGATPLKAALKAPLQLSELRTRGPKKR